ncbi:MAG: Ku protein [Actinobacteria bacterium]|nr:Ku protein [Actinomycetota bacterium]
MPRSIWSGAISFGLVNIPIRLVTAVDRKNVSFREIRRTDGSRIRHRKVAADDGAEVASEDIAKGYEVGPDRYVVVDPAELKALDPESTKTIDIEDFVDLADIDPIFFDSAYYLLPSGTAAKPYKLLHTAMVRTGKAGIARFVLRTKQYLAVVRPLGEALAISTMVYADEVIQPSQLEGLPDEDVEVSERELAMAVQLVESLATEWEPERYRDEYREQVLAMLEAKAAGEEIVLVPEAEREAGDVVDLMSALEASLDAAREGRSRDAESA